MARGVGTSEGHKQKTPTAMEEQAGSRRAPVLKANTYRTHNDPSRFWETFIYREGQGFIAIARGEDEADAQAIADEIVRAVNCHEELVAACRAALEVIDFCLPYVVSEQDQRVVAEQQLKAALAKSEGR